jgi:sulfur carrier protein
MNLIRIIPAKGSGQDDNSRTACSGFRPPSRLLLPFKDKRLFLFERTAMDILVNGKRETGPPCTIAELLAQKGLLTNGLVVELNRRIVKHEEWQTVQLKENDAIELLGFVGGG